MHRLQALRLEPCDNSCRQTWLRVWTVRGNHVHLSELSWTLARRLIPRLLARYGVTDLAGLFTGRLFSLPRKDYP